jgi:hypothetical protein
MAVLQAMPTAAADGWTIAYKGELEGRRTFRVTHAASELASYMGRVLGSELTPVPWADAQGENIILITDSRHAPKELAAELAGTRGDAFLIRYPYTYEDKTVCLLLAHDAHGYDFPVYYFLRRFMGVDWVGPGELGQVVPAAADWQMPTQIAVRENPDFEHRYWGDYRFAHARPLMAGSHRMDFHHAFGKIYAPKKYAATDPDLYPLIDGKRRVPDPEHEATAGWQPCVGNPKTQDLAVKWVLDVFAREPTTVSVSLSVNDGGANDCMCERCRAMDIADAFADPLHPQLSDRYFRFYNHVAERVREVEPRAIIAVLGYGPCAVPPRETKIHDAVCVFISTGANPRQFEGAGGGSSLYHYHLDNAYPTIRHYPQMIAKYLRESHRAGGMGYYAQIEHSWAAGGPKTYVLAQLLWDVDSDVDLLLDRYMDRAFGARAAAAMRAYYDRWETIWGRESAVLPNRYDTIYMWNSDHIRKFRFVSWGDIHYLDAAMDIASKAAKTPPQTQRLALFTAYYQWIRCSLVQALMARDLANTGWLAAQPPDAVLDRAEAALALTEEFDSRWSDSIARDRTGWLLNQKSRLVAAVGRGERYYDSLLVGPIRAEVEAELARSVGAAMQSVSGRLAAADSKAAAVAFWRAAQPARAALAPFIGPEVDRLRGIVHKNKVRNGGFEDGTAGGTEPGAPPVLPGWWFYDRVGMVVDAKAKYRWDDSESRDGSKAIGLGPGKYPGMRTFVELAPGRYRCSFWYRTVNRTIDCEVSLYLLSADVAVDELSSPAAVRALQNKQYIKFLRRSWPPTDGEWKQVVQTFEIKEKRGLALTLEPFYMNEGAWTWFDDVEIRRLYGGQP